MRALIDLSIVIITWNSAEDVAALLESIDKTVRTPHELVLVDNGSTDDTIDRLRSATPTAHLVVNQRNRGVAPARNQGLALARGRYLMTLDADTVLWPAAADELVAFMDRHSEVGLAGPRVVVADGHLELTCKLFPSVVSKVLRTVVPLRWAERLLPGEHYLHWDHWGTREVDYVNGMCQIIRREAFEEVGLLDDHMFYGPEDVDYCLRVWRAGWSVAYHSAAVITHGSQRLCHRKFLSRVTWEHLKAMVRYFRKHRYLFRVAGLRSRGWFIPDDGGIGHGERGVRQSA